MSRKIPKIKGIDDNSKIKAIGNMFRRLDCSNWRVNVQLDPKQKKLSLAISQIPLLARKRTLNTTETPKPAGFKKEFILDKSPWSAVKIKEVPIPGVSNQQDHEQWCFKFMADDIQVYLPQLELARALFLYEPYLCRLAMIPDGLIEEFDIIPLDDPNSIQVNLLPSCSLPQHVRGDNELRRALATIILDKDMRQSFESISRYQLEYGEDNGHHRVWQFRFAPPPLDQVRLAVRGHFDSSTSSMFVYEIYGMQGLKSNHPHNVHFFDPSYTPKTPGKGTALPVRPINIEDIEIDDDEIPQASGGVELVLQAPQVTRTYQNPAHTTRSGVTKGRPSGGKKEGEADEEGGDNTVVISIDETSKNGHVIAGGTDTIDDQSDDSKNYTARFEAFNAMLEMLKAMGCKVDKSKPRQLPVIAGYSKQASQDSNPRCWLVKTLTVNGATFRLMEVDTLGSKKRLSTLLVKEDPSTNVKWENAISEIAKRLVTDSLTWPTAYLNETFKSDNVQRIAHPKSPAANKDFLDADSITSWAQRILDKCSNQPTAK